MDETPQSDPARDSERKTSSRWLTWGSGLFGTGFVRLQATLILVALAVWIFLRIVGANSSLPGSLIFTLCIGNWSALLIHQVRPLFVGKRPPWNWIIFLVLILVGGITGSIFADAVIFLLFHGRLVDFPKQVMADAPTGTLVTLIFGIISFLFEEQREKLETKNRDLQGQVQLGWVKEKSHEAELEQAHEIQRHLLPRETPQLAGFQIACARQPAKSVSGDYFDVLDLGEGRLGLCVADVSGKGITAALLMANLQASVKAFAQEAKSPAALCAKLNSVLCGSVAPGKFVTLFYGIVDSSQRKLHYENAGHCLPLLVHKDGSILLPASYSGVLGLFSHWTYQDNELQLESGDCLVIVTDGVLEAANAKEEEFGYQRLIQAVNRSKESGVHAVRQAILEDVTKFCAGKFDDDASLIVVTVD